VIYKAFTSLGLERFKIRLNNRKVLGGVFAVLGLEERAGDVMRTIDKLEKIGAEKVKTILTEDFSVPEQTAGRLLELLSSGEPMAALEELRGRSELLDQGMDLDQYKEWAKRQSHGLRCDDTLASLEEHWAGLQTQAQEQGQDQGEGPDSVAGGATMGGMTLG